MDSSIKRNTAVIKKLKQINEEQREALMDELRSVNLSKFVSEAVTAICDAKLRTSDIQAAVQVHTFDFFLQIIFFWAVCMLFNFEFLTIRSDFSEERKSVVLLYYG